MDEARLRALSVGGAVAVTVVLGVAFAALATIFGTANAVMALFVVLFVVVLAYESIYDQLEGALDRDSGPDAGTAESALDTLRARYARDELSRAEFERKLETLLETETTADAERHVHADPEPSESHDLERDRG